LIVDLTAQMHEAARALKFEEAVGLRNAIQAIESISENNSVEDMDPENRDYIAWATEGIFTTFSVLSMRSGRMTGRELYSSRSAAEENESLESFIVAYYSPDRPPPPRIYLAAFPDRERSGTTPGTAPIAEEKVFSALERYFSEQFGFTPELVSPDERRHIAALTMARQNAQEELHRRLRERGAGPALDELARVLGLKTRPERIEGFDIAQLEGKHPVASMISFKYGVPDRKNYRYFKLKTVVGIVDDFASMREAVKRRYSRLVREGRELPDLVLIDGGIGQVNAAKGVMDELGIDCDVAGLAKRDEEIWLPNAANPIKLSRRSEALKVLQFVRDETHRFATGLNQRLRSKDLYFPVLESIEGIGPKRAAAIMKTYGELEKIAAAKPEDIVRSLSGSCAKGGGKRGIALSAAKAVRAAARLALEDRDEKKKKLAAKTGFAKTGASKSAAAMAEEAALPDEAFAAEVPPEYE
jgi:excinuclease ABC subunit C